MPELLEVALFAGGIMGALFLLGVLIYSPRARRWSGRALKEGEAVCRDCNYVGTLSYGILAGVRVTSANIRLVCGKCNSQNWYVPGGKRDRRSAASSESKP